MNKFATTVTILLAVLALWFLGEFAMLVMLFASGFSFVSLWLKVRKGEPWHIINFVRSSWVCMSRFECACLLGWLALPFVMSWWYAALATGVIMLPMLWFQNSMSVYWLKDGMVQPDADGGLWCFDCCMPNAISPKLAEGLRDAYHRSSHRWV